MKGEIGLVYLDNASTTKVYPEVVKAITDVLTNDWANPSSNYSIADKSRVLIEQVREQFAEDLNCDPSELIFTSSGCESNSLAIAGFLKNNRGYDVYLSDLEHASIRELVNDLFHLCGHVIIPVNSVGEIDPDTLRSLLIERQKYSNYKPFVTIQGANSEIGVIEDIKALAEVTHQYSGIFHCDAVQLFPEKQLDVKDLGVDMLSISGQKFHAGRGCAVLYVRKELKSWLSPLIYGTQESGVRGGSYNTSAIVGMGKALEINRLNKEKSHVKTLRDKLLDKLLTIPHTWLNGPKTYCNRLENNISLTIEGVPAEELMTMCDLNGIIIAKGSACQSHVPTPSPALLAIGLTAEQALNTIRITLDEFNTEDEIDEAAETIIKLVEVIRSNAT